MATLCFRPLLHAQEKELNALRLGGLLFGDLYHIPNHHLDEGKGASGAVLRRAYFTFDADFGQHWFSRVRIEVNQAGEFETYSLKANFKDLYAGLNAGKHRVMFGLSPTPTFDLIESHWGLRYLARTPMDLQGVASRDFGLSANGPVNRSGSIGYRAMIGSGIHFGNETGDGWQWMSALSWNPSQVWTFDLFMDYERLPGPVDRTTFQIFAGYKTDRLRWGLQYSHQDRQENPNLQLISGYVVGKIVGKSSLIGRIDRIMEPSPEGNNISYLPFDPDSKATFFIAGLELPVTSYFLITPNVVFIDYDENKNGSKPENDLHLRLTLLLDLEHPRSVLNRNIHK